MEAVAVRQTQEFVGEAAVEVVCEAPHNPYGGSGPRRTIMTCNTVTPPEQARGWLRQALFGEVVKDESPRWNAPGKPDGPTLPDVLASSRAVGWQAEGVARLYAVEELAREWGGRFVRLEVGTASGSGIPVRGEFVLKRHEQTCLFEGVVPLTG